MTQERIWILGAADPEMEMIEALLRECGEQVVHATIDSVRVHAGNAYRCLIPEVPMGSTVYAVECIDVLPEGWTSIDHHWPGDPGYGQPPENFMAASSIGQVIAELARLGRLPMAWRQCDWTPGVYYYAPTFTLSAHSAANRSVSRWIVEERFEIPTEYVLAAAADHCLAAAYRGECPGVDPDELMRWRAETRAAFQSRSVDDVLADVERARKALRGAPSVELMGMGDMPHTEDHDWGRSVCDGCARDPVYARDMRGQRVPELPEASAREGLCFVADGLPDRDGRVKVICQSGTPEQIQAFMDVWAPSQGLVDIYGDPQRGFAGGYFLE